MNQVLQESNGHFYSTSTNQSHPFATRADVLQHWGEDFPIPDSTSLQLLYLGIFLCPESAFVLMALREYINAKRGIREVEWMFGEQDNKALETIRKQLEQAPQNPK